MDLVWLYRRKRSKQRRYRWDNSFASLAGFLLDNIVDVVAKALSSSQSVDEVLGPDGFQTCGHDPILEPFTKLGTNEVCDFIKVFTAKMLGDLTF